jgi:hypothetical protein
VRELGLRVGRHMLVYAKILDAGNIASAYSNDVAFIVSG